MRSSISAHPKGWVSWIKIASGLATNQPEPHSWGNIVLPAESKRDRGQPGSGRLGIKPDAHQGHRLDDPKTIRKAPAQKRAVARRHQDSGATKGFGRGNERLHVEVALRRCMAE